ncbi:permease [Haloprofundus marisrubri]|uniref:Permease n=1 Tax=Haloprofundus marisrubri TaxID=1514971 RepID=A0A0W1R419_9EURY|nr:AI-2E family transporter [Haloprofundus marisrubri]KTG07963.1 permease [Haloprofundus marisrubri]
MTFDRRYVLGGLFVVTALLAAVILADVLATVFFAITVAYLLSPLRRELTRRGLSAWTASAVATAGAFLGVVVVAAPLVGVLVLRFEALRGLLDIVPDAVTLELAGYVYTVTFDEATAVTLSVLRSLAQDVVVAAPVLLIKLSVFALVVFALLIRAGTTRESVFALVPPGYRDVATALDERARDTLFAIYVLQAATAVGTFLVAIVVFALLGYDFPVALATVAAVLQFIPVLGPSLLLLLLAAYHLTIGQTVAALLVLVVGGFFVAFLPDVLIRPRLAQRTANLPGSIYFVGFVGGLLSLGALGVIVGPLVVALVLESAELLSSELKADASNKLN